MRIYQAFPGGRAKALTMSYDDGKLADERLLEIFNRYGIKGTFNLNYGLMDMEIRLKPEQIPRLYRGHEIATHTMTHPTIARCPLVQAAKEILEDREGLERITGGLVRGHAYPNGSYNEEIKDLFQKLGIAYARVVEETEGFELPSDPMEWHPTCHHNHPRLLEMAQWFADFPKRQYLKLLYVWGHSYEFDADGNWDRIEAFCRIVGAERISGMPPILRSSTICRCCGICNTLRTARRYTIPRPKVPGWRWRICAPWKCPAAGM